MWSWRCAVLSLLSETSYLIGQHSAVQLRPPPYIRLQGAETLNLNTCNLIPLTPASLAFPDLLRSEFQLNPKM